MKNSMNRAAALTAAVLMLACTTAAAASFPRSLATDPRIKQLQFDPNQVVEVVGVFGNVTTIQFAPGERILNKAIGDSIAWQTRKFRNQIAIKPVEADARTNMTVTTDRNVYYFNLSSTKDPSKATYAVRFVYPKPEEDDDSDTDVSATGGFQQPRFVNSDYLVSGNEEAFGLQRVADDGQFTYFLFSADKSKPGVYVVDEDGTEVLPEIRREGPYLVVPQMANRFTIRDGARILCVIRRAALVRKARSAGIASAGSVL
ncbi:type VI secretion protein [Burkholderia pseudomultivorans]|uniref:TrbG/VirB9 family P-type conjugative transfer protein n=1 Tax=Burkholderia pseudomultivorans TaxID=1207504 RepID=UPI00075EEB4C|nr:TrbG/VirB9 family P-type conjugative transfer protein [Burkholderia pseudomultivorans]AOI94130.1 type VI secretion protein [Burkholderia pseudomultivorans]KVC27792.1 type VI secretion protein [Burkholderia pseudomultivorans]KVC36914.1 type VI secretion protein [Burkholderia pseudomultivorans]KVC42155.1 type VI secretion protein [Burkholderia pseudomultivorans]